MIKTLKILLQLWPFFAFLAFGLLDSCGGGSGGTGFPTTGDERLLSGQVVSQTAAPLEGVSVTVVETGRSTVTDSKGAFVLAAPPDNNNINLLIQSPSVETSVSVKPVADASQLRVDVTLNTDSGTTSIDQIDAKAQIIGECDTAFENGSIIRQSDSLDSGVSCVVKVTVYGDGKLLPGIPVVVQYRACDESAEWSNISVDNTAHGPHRGVAQVSFPYFDTDQYCEYRVIAPFNDPNHAPIFFPIHTFRKQAFDEAQAKLSSESK
jgi:hypothetical protein